MKTISSAQTFLMKVVFPAAWISGFGFGTLTLWLDILHGRNGSAPPPEMRWQFLAVWVIGTVLILRCCAGLKKVRIDSTRLYISNFRKEIAVPFNNIVGVSENRLINIHPVTIHFRVPTEFGQHITFMPALRVFGFLSSHPVVAQLRALAGVKSD